MPRRIEIDPISGNLAMGRPDRDMLIQVLSMDTALSAGDDQMRIPIPPSLDGALVVGIKNWVKTVSSSGIVTFQVYNEGQSGDVLSTESTIDAGENYSGDAAMPEVVDSTKALLTAGKYLRFDCDGAGTGVTGWVCVLQVLLP